MRRPPRGFRRTPSANEFLDPGRFGRELRAKPRSGAQFSGSFACHLLASKWDWRPALRRSTL
jgi:hypothetical protein